VTHVAVVTLVHRRADHLRRQARSLALGDRPPDDYVVVAMDDHVSSVPDTARVVHVGRAAAGLPLAAARNRGVESALESGADVVVCLDVDCLAGPTLVGAYTEAVVQHPLVVWSGPVTYLAPPGPDGYPLTALASLDEPHPARPAPVPGTMMVGAEPDLFWSLSFAVAASAWRTVDGFCEDYVGYGGEDTDFARAVVHSGLDLGWVGAARAYHQWHPVSAPPVEHLHDIVRNAGVFHDRWGTWPMLGWLEEFERRGLVARDRGRWSVVAGTGR